MYAVAKIGMYEDLLGTILSLPGKEQEEALDELLQTIAWLLERRQEQLLQGHAAQPLLFCVDCPLKRDPL